MSRSAPMRLVILAAFSLAAPELALGTEARSEARYPDYDVGTFCRSEIAARAERRHQCEDREHAVSILLRRSWSELARSEPTLVEACAAMIVRHEAFPSYVSLLQCLTRVRDAAD